MSWAGIQAIFLISKPDAGHTHLGSPCGEAGVTGREVLREFARFCVKMPSLPQIYVLDDEFQQCQYLVRPDLKERSEGGWELINLTVIEAVEMGSAGQVLQRWLGEKAQRFVDRAWQIVDQNPLVRELMEHNGPVPQALPEAETSSAARALERLRNYRQQSAQLKQSDNQTQRKQSG